MAKAKIMAKNVTLGLQSGTEDTIYAKWTFTKKHVKEYQYKWEYLAGKIWFIGSTGSTSSSQKIITYNAPSNATSVRFTVKPVSTKDKKVNGTKTTWWTASWSTKKTYSVAKLVEVPSTPSISVDADNKYKALIEVEDSNDVNKSIQFQVVRIKGTSTVFHTSMTVAKQYNQARGLINISAGFEYAVRCRGVNGTHVSKWTDFSSAVSTIPSKVKKAPVCTAVSASSIKVTWDKVDYAKTYSVEYASEIEHFNGSTNTQTVNNITGTSKTIDGLTTGTAWYFRVKSVNDSGESDYSAISEGVILGKEPNAPTTWSMTSKISIADGTVALYWNHNSVDGSSMTSAEILLNIDGIDQPVISWTNDRNEYEKDNVVRYELNISKYPDSTVIKWKVRTKGILDTFSEWSIERQIDVYAPISLSVSIPSLEDGNLTSFPFTVHMNVGNTNQNAIGYHISIIANESFISSEDDDTYTSLVSAGEEIYYRDYDVVDEDESNICDMILSAGDVDLLNDISYTIKCTVAMDSGLSNESSIEFHTAFADFTCFPNMEFGLDEEHISATILPYCVDESETDDEILTENVTLSVFRKNYDGSFTELASGIANDKCTWVYDPHPALDYARYRIIALSTVTGQSVYCDFDDDDLEMYIGESSIIIQWNECWGNMSVESTDDTSKDLSEDNWSAYFLRLPYNVTISDNNSPDVALVKYIGRTHPVSYYGTQVGETPTWSAEIPKDDTETIAMLRLLSVWMGDCYVREPSGSGYWANVKVSFNQSYDSLVIPITLNITRVEGGM